MNFGCCKNPPPTTTSNGFCCVECWFYKVVLGYVWLVLCCQCVEHVCTIVVLLLISVVSDRLFVLTWVLSGIPWTWFLSIWSHVIWFGFQWSHLVWLVLAWSQVIHAVALGLRRFLSWVQHGSLDLTWIHSVSLGFALFHCVSPGHAWSQCFHLISWCHLVSLHLSHWA